MGHKQILKFPDGFLWGTAISSYQTEGNNINTDWWKWENSKPNIKKSGSACDHYNKYKEDILLAKKGLHNNAFRFSIEWSRIEPAKGVFDQKEIQHYKDVLEEIKKQQMVPFVTLHHFTSPIWFANEGGFGDSKNIKYFEEYVKRCIEEFGNQVTYWTIFNEPNVYTGMSYLFGQWPPQGKSIINSFKVFTNLAKAHNSCYRLIHLIDKQAIVSSVINTIYFKEKSRIKLLSSIDNFVVNDLFYLMTKKNHDIIAINVYAMHECSIKEMFIRNIEIDQHLKNMTSEKTDMGWNIYPQAIYEITKRFWAKYKLPIYITENGIADKKDAKRQSYINNYLTWLYQALVEGVDVRGYFHWSLMDNFEWSLGKSAHFGLYKTDYKTLERIPRKSAAFYANICKNNGITVS